MTDTPIGDELAAKYPHPSELGILHPAVPPEVDEDASPDAYEEQTDTDPPPVMNEDADDRLAGLPEGKADDTSDLDGDDEQQ